MSSKVNELKAEIKELKRLLKKSTSIYTAEVYGRQLEDANLSLRHHQLVKRVTESNVDYAEWWEWAQSLYSVDSYFRVVSKARDWKEVVSWECDSEIGAKERIEKLIGYKILDRKRGHGNMGKDLDEGVSE